MGNRLRLGLNQGEPEFGLFGAYWVAVSMARGK